MAVVKVTRRKSRSQLLQQIIPSGLNGMGAWGDLVERRATELAPVETSHLAQSIHRDAPAYIGDGVFRVRVGVNNVPYAAAHEFGSGLHRPKNPAKYPIWAGKLNPGDTGSLNPKWALAFEWPGGPGPSHPAFNPEIGKFVFAKVMHPGVEAAHQGRGYLRYAKDLEHARGRRIFVKAITAGLKGSNGG